MFQLGFEGFFKKNWENCLEITHHSNLEKAICLVSESFTLAKNEDSFSNLDFIVLSIVM